MTLESLGTTLEALQKNDVRFLIAGGLAVIAHGHLRVTHDLDLVLALEPENTSKAIEALSAVGFQPRLPVRAMDFCDPQIRSKWIAEKNLQVFSMISEPLGGFVIDIFAEEPFDFAEEFASSIKKSLVGLDESYPFVSKETLIRMKKLAGRSVDLDDIDKLNG